MKMFFDFANKINNSKIFAGMIMIMLNIGSKYITIKLSKTQEEYFKNSIARQLLIFSIVWMGTRDIILSLFLTATFIVLTDHLFNEESKFCVIPAYLKNHAHILDTNNDGYVSKEEVENAMKIVEKANKQKRKQSHLRMAENFSNQY
jgi:uncharacterized protein YegP (UPF0339 family)